MHELKYNKSYPGGIPIVSITMSTFNRPDILENTLKSIRQNKTSLPYEVIVVDDGSSDRHYNFCICKRYSATYIYINFPDVRGPAVPRNMAARAARGEILIMQSDDVMHTQPNTIDMLCQLNRGESNQATVRHQPNDMLLSGSEYKRPFFWLGSIYKQDFWDIGGNDEDFKRLGFEDTLLGANVARNYKVNYLDDLLGHHQQHRRTPSSAARQDVFGMFKSKIAEMDDVVLDCSVHPHTVTITNDKVGTQTFVV